MKIITSAFLILFSVPIYIFGQTKEAITNDGEKVILNADGTWSYANHKNDTIEYDKSILVGGCWFFPHQAVVNIKFYDDLTFKFHNLKVELLTGTFKITGKDVWLNFKDGAKKKFFIDKQSTKEFYLKSYPTEKPEYYLVHSEDWVHPNLE